MVGHARTFLKKFSLSPLNIGSGLEAKRTFLRLVQPTPLLPQRATFRASSLYIMPFYFKVPERLPGQACIQWNARREVRAAHLAVPPTFGKQNGTDDQIIPQPNTTPNSGSISYYIRVKVVADKQINVLDETLLGETWRALRLTPVVDEIGPLDTCNTAGLDYSASDTAYLEKARWQGTLGKVIMQVRQPKSLCLPISTGYNGSNIKSVETTVFIKLIFEPVEPDGMPPNLERLSCKLRTGTLFNTTPLFESPFSIGTNRMDGTLNGLSVASTPMLDQSVGNLAWQESVRPLHSSIQSPLQRASGSRGFKVFTINVAVPLRLAIDKREYLPTFHSCLISHFHVIDLLLTLQTPGKPLFPKKKSLHVEVPLQVISDVFCDESSGWSESEDG